MMITKGMAVKIELVLHQHWNIISFIVNGKVVTKTTQVMINTTQVTRKNSQETITDQRKRKKFVLPKKNRIFENLLFYFSPDIISACVSVRNSFSLPCTFTVFDNLKYIPVEIGFACERMTN